MRVLLLGGTAESHELATALAASGIEVIESVAGRTRQAQQQIAGRVGGFGGATGLAEYLNDADVQAVVDATHPFATTMTNNAAQACQVTATPILRFVRPGWENHPDAPRWTWVNDHPSAARAAAELVGTPARGPILLTVGRQPLPAYHALTTVLARVAQWQDIPVPTGWTILEARGPFALADELDLIRRTGIHVLVSKDSGGDYTAAKLQAARQLNVDVVMIRRPPTPAGLTLASTVTDVLAWTRSL